MKIRPTPSASLRTLAALGLVALTPMIAPAAWAEVPEVVVSIKPVHALVAGVMGDLGTPMLLVKGANSPHSYAMKPSDARALQEADVIFRVGENLEVFMNHPLETLGAKATVVDLAEAKGIETLGFREGALWEEDEHHHDGEEHETAEDDHEEADHHHDHHGADPHVWLDPVNARAMVDAITEKLAAADPEHAEAYAANAARMNGRITELQEEIAAELKPVEGRPFIVFHDGYHYFEHRFGVEAAGAVAVDPERQPGAARVTEIRERIEKADAVCVFTEPQFQPRLVKTLIEGTDARSGVLDPLGADLPEGAGAYEALLRNLAKSLESCLAGS